MLSHTDLLELERSLRGRMVLTVYVNGEERDPAQQRKWRVDLRHALDDISTWLVGAPHEDREAFASCRSMAMERLSAYRASVGAPGWAGFFTADGEVHAGGVPTPMPTMAVWSTGGCLAPYFRALPEATPVFVVVADARKARLFQYAERRHKLLDTMRAHSASEPGPRMGQQPRLGFHGGTRGATGADELQREKRVGTERYLGEVAAALVRLAGKSGWIVVGGIPEVAVSLIERLPADLKLRTTHATGLDVHAAGGTVAAVARLSTLAMREAADRARLDEVVAEAAAEGAGCVGWMDTTRAVHEGRARDLYFGNDYAAAHSAGAEELVRAAMANGTAVHAMCGESGARLDKLGGVAARLRYAVPVAEELVTAQAASERW